MTTKELTRAYNFNAGPAALPLPVLEQVQKDLLNYKGTGMSVMEMSHRSKEFMAINDNAEATLRRLLKISDDYEVLFLQGGASLQFPMVAMNLGQKDKPIDVIHSGYWTKKAIAEFEKLGKVNILASSEKENFTKIPDLSNVKPSADASFFYITANNTIYGTQYPSFPETGNTPLVADMTSDLLSREIDVSKFGAIFAGAQKNLGPSGLAVVIIRKDLAERADKSLPTMFQYRTHIKNKSLYNTPPTLAIYITSLVFEWIEKEGGLKEIEKRNRQKAKTLFDVVDGSDFYTSPIEKNSRSFMNVVFRVKNDEALESKFLEEAKTAGFVGLKGHRAIGGLRASIYTPQPVESVEALAGFMKDFEKKNS